MRFAFAVGALVALCQCSALLAMPSINLQPALSHAIIAEVNAANAGWTAGHNDFFAGKSLESAKRLMGIAGEKVDLPVVGGASNAVLPDNFDSRTQWPGCIGPVVDQGDWYPPPHPSLQCRCV